MASLFESRHPLDGYAGQALSAAAIMLRKMGYSNEEIHHLVDIGLDVDEAGASLLKLLGKAPDGD